jgi:hypothetical protein
LLNGEIFDNIFEARTIIERWSNLLPENWSDQKVKIFDIIDKLKAAQNEDLQNYSAANSILKQAETGIPVKEVIRKMGISEQTFLQVEEAIQLINSK